MPNEARTITLLVSDPSSGDGGHEDRASGETRALKGLWRSSTTRSAVSFDQFKSRLTETISQIDELFDEVGSRISETWEIDTVTVSLGVSAEGSIGIATTGVEASIEISISPKPVE